jgi:hypothetical protein
MATTKRRTMIAATMGVWLAAVGSAAALTYDLNRPLEQRVHGSQLPAPSARADSSLGLEEAQEAPQSVLKVPPITIVGARHRVGPAPARTPTVPRDISEMRCGEPRELDLGSGHVQICE